MKLIERVYYSLVGKKVKTLLLLLVVTLLGSFLSASFSIYQSNTELEETIYKKLKPIILIDWKRREQENGSYIEIENKKKIIIEELKKDSRIHFLENRYDLELGCFHLTELNLLNEEGKKLPLGNDMDFSATKGNQIVSGMIPNVYCLYGIDNYLVSDLKNGTLSLAKGRVFTETEMKNGDNVLLYTANYDANNLYSHYYEEIKKCQTIFINIDKVTYIHSGTLEDDLSIIEYDVDYKSKFQMIGIAEDNEFNLKEPYHSGSFFFGRLYLPIKALEKISEDLQEIYFKILNDNPSIKEFNEVENVGLIQVDDSYIELNYVGDLNQFVDGLKANHGDLIENIYSYTDSYNDVKVVTNNLNTIAIISLVVCSIASIILLSLIIQVFVHERRHEIGIYLSMGESRKKVMTQILLEVLLVGMIGISLSIFSGHMISKGLSSDLLERQIIQQEEVQGSHYDDSFEINREEILDTYSVEITVEYVICVYTGGFIVLILSSIYPMNSILKMKPKKMLM